MRTATGGVDSWAIVLAGGDGVRLRALTEWLTGEAKPKQFCALGGHRSLLEETLRRAGLSAPPDRQLVVVTRRHEPHWAPLLDSTLASTHVVIQPDNRGTAVALLLALQAVESMAGDVPVIILPSDHHVGEEELFMAHVDDAVRWTGIYPDSPVLLGIDATYPETDYGWIEPARLAPARPASLHRVRRFWEKPQRSTALSLLARGCLWNSMVMVGRTSAFLRLMQATLPALVGVMDPLRRLPGFRREQYLRSIYAELPVLGFSERVMASRPQHCLVARVSGVAWTDLGSPARVLADHVSASRETC
jgi:mannose-1-phosphate guanylyltransferase